MMGRLGALAARLWLLALAGGLTSCALADQYSGHAVVFNLEAEQTQDQVLLLNIVRAYQRRPMQFTTLDNISGQTTVQGMAQATVPPWQGMFNAQVMSGPTYGVPVLDTQAFYRGILSPVPSQLIDLYVQQGYSRDLIYNLFLQKIVAHRMDCPIFVHTHDCEVTFRNYVGDDLDLDLFQTLLGYLIRLGITTELLPKAPKKGVQSADDQPDTRTRLAGEPPSSGLELVAASSKKPPKKDGKDDGDGDGGDGDSTSKLAPYQFCFAPPDRRFHGYLIPTAACDHPASAIEAKHGKTILPGVYLAPIAKQLQDIVERELGRPDSGAKGLAGIGVFAGHWVSLQFYTRSAEGIIYYLGEVARRQLAEGPKQ